MKQISRRSFLNTAGMSTAGYALALPHVLRKTPENTVNLHIVHDAWTSLPLVPVDTENITHAHKILKTANRNIRMRLVANFSHSGYRLHDMKHLYNQSHACGLPVLFYSNGCRNEEAYKAYPRWRQKPASHKDYHFESPGIGSMCPNSPYMEQILLKELSALCSWGEQMHIWIHNLEFETGTCGCRYCTALAKRHGIVISTRSGRKELRNLTQQHVRLKIQRALSDACHHSNTMNITLINGFGFRRLTEKRYLLIDSEAENLV